jgi:hypothetical protein
MNVHDLFVLSSFTLLPVHHIHIHTHMHSHSYTVCFLYLRRATMSLKSTSVIARSSLFIGMDWHNLQNFAVTPPYVPPRAAEPVRARRTTMANAPEAESKPIVAPRPRRPSAAGKLSYLESTTASRMNTILAPITRASRGKDDLQKLVDMAGPAIAALDEYKGDQSIFAEF